MRDGIQVTPFWLGCKRLPAETISTNHITDERCEPAQDAEGLHELLQWENEHLLQKNFYLFMRPEGKKSQLIFDNSDSPQTQNPMELYS